MTVRRTLTLQCKVHGSQEQAARRPTQSASSEGRFTVGEGGNLPLGRPAITTRRAVQQRSAATIATTPDPRQLQAADWPTEETSATTPPIVRIEGQAEYLTA